MNTFEHKNSLRIIEAQIVQKLKNNETRPKFTGSYKKKACICSNFQLISIKNLSALTLAALLVHSYIH